MAELGPDGLLAVAGIVLLSLFIASRIDRMGRQKKK
jgi:hypothetical protein